MWERAADAYGSQIAGPHFEHLARTWTALYSGDRWGTPIGVVGPAVVNDPAGRAQHELDVVALASGDRRATSAPAVVVIGEAKATSKQRTAADLHRLEKIRDLLVERGVNAAGARLALFSRHGFDPRLTDLAAHRDDVHLVALEDLYQDRSEPSD